MKVYSRKELEQIASSHLSGIDSKVFMNLHKDYTKTRCSFLVNVATLSS